MTPETSHLTQRGAASRARMVDAAADVMHQRGVAATSLDDVLAVSATSKSQLYHYFADKDHLVRAVVRRQTERVVASQLPDGETFDSIAALRRWRNRILVAQADNDYVGGCPVGSMANELAESSEATRKILQECFTEWQNHFVTGLSAMKARGRLRPDADPEAIAESMMAALQGGLLLAKVYRTKRPLARALDMAIEHVQLFTV